MKRPKFKTHWELNAFREGQDFMRERIIGLLETSKNMPHNLDCDRQSVMGCSQDCPVPDLIEEIQRLSH